MIPEQDDDFSDDYNFGYLDEKSKRAIRRALVKAVAIPGHQVPFSSKEMPLPPGWGTGGIQVTASLIGREDRLKVIDQGADDATNATSIRNFFTRVAGIETTTEAKTATIVQTRHRIPETVLSDEQILVVQVPTPDPLRRINPRVNETRTMHAFGDYGRLYVVLYEDLARHGQVSTSFDYPIQVNGRYVSSPSPVPKFDNPKFHQNPALVLFGAGRERRVYAIPPYTDVRSLDFIDRPFTVQKWNATCVLCGSDHSYLDELVTGDDGQVQFICSDTDYCETRQAEASGDAQ
ncbi:alpha-D-ribose 1-methylphosphonate 5-phosphate C-P-lyase PhnJ [Rhizobium miluonense]|uniref:Alpha-D-ribose 1-methylphosphonate 5-phosphate C-P lyase n=1 Tax=Rhizobium miluonense TaxID=411945 RepID=A0A1C3WDM1_9HYPH|nr:alpha-D-ribose 1-methylphosphonate 5-phosphate C-P-lyase PhnJ [Rhizobium miluonense]SCB37995.1 alpha-D-ribose 1-methylphosphonate 5-phosphate C-P lyase [Rhizobium miluonense]